MIDKLWNKFYESGSVEDYLKYKDAGDKGGEDIERKNFGNCDERKHNQRERQGFDDSYE